MKFTRAWFTDAAERVVSSFVEAVLALVVAGGVSGFNASTAHVLLGAGLAAAFATAKTVIAGSKGGNAAITLPKTGRQRGWVSAQVLLVWLLIAIAVIILVLLIQHHVHIH